VREDEVTGQIDELVGCAIVLDASCDEQNGALVNATASRVRELSTALYAVFDDGPRVWRPAMAGAWLAMSSATHAEEEAGAGEVNGDLLGAWVSFACSGVRQLAQSWNGVVGGQT
jgi:hypothetical protein